MLDIMINKSLEIIMSAMIVATLVIGFLEVCFRYLLNSSLTWSYEVLMMLLVYMTFVGAFLSLRRRAHLRVTVIVERMPRWGQIICFIIGQLTIIGTASIMTIWGWDYAFRFPYNTTEILRIPVAYLYVIVPISGFAILLQSLFDMWRGFVRIANGYPPEEFDAQVK